MSTPAEKVAELALVLTRDEHAALADRLVDDLDPVDEDLVRDVWIAEAKRRLGEIRFGAVAAIDLDDVKVQVASALR